MDLRHLRYVVAAARNGSFSAAGHELNVQQPIVSKRVRELEDELGVFLFERATSGARLTPAGEEFVIGAERVINAVRRLSERARASGAGSVGRIVVGSYRSLSSRCFRSALQAFREQFPGVEVELTEGSLVELKAAITSGAIDLAIILGDMGEGGILGSKPLWSGELLVVLPDDHPLAEHSTIYWPELRGERFLISQHDPGPDLRNILLRHLCAPSQEPEIVMLHLGREAILSEVGSGQGISLQCDAASCAPDLAVLFKPIHDGNGAMRLGYNAFWRPDNGNPVLKTFLDTLNFVS